MSEISPAALQSLLRSEDPCARIDVRERGEFALEHIPGTTPLAHGTIEYRVETMIPNRQIPTVVCCDDGRRSQLAASTLSEMGYEDVSVLAGGLERWRAGGFPTRQGWGVPGKEYGEKVAVTKTPPEISASELASGRSRGEKIFVIDVRTEEEFVRGHVPQAFSIVVLADDEIRPVWTAALFQCLGFRRVSVLRGGIAAWARREGVLEQGEPKWKVHGLKTARKSVSAVKPGELRELLEHKKGVLLLDVRGSGEFGFGHIPAARWLARGKLELQIRELAPVNETRIITMCDTGVRSILSGATLKSLGYLRVDYLEGGIRAWQKKGLPIEDGLEGSGITVEEAQGDFGHTLWKGALGKSRVQMERYLSWEEALGQKYDP